MNFWRSLKLTSEPHMVAGLVYDENRFVWDPGKELLSRIGNK